VQRRGDSNVVGSYETTAGNVKKWAKRIRKNIEQCRNIAVKATYLGVKATSLESLGV
jgi:hypothetical protein